ncbi:Uncharacterized protein PECH_003550 [Penicillium ucsense]|uniref:Uncharacterized protein n=1 Tax=Penicillium ucsense TaxID=2839758 RepID=A0A8J8WIG0_9EURO|nr:Uncharacterized protein PECM_007439 [Penicillium ucsense]KAF7737630.1 Uncharacterized protein PECH_003550 [Penicillium ucsense]
MAGSFDPTESPRDPSGQPSTKSISAKDAADAEQHVPILQGSATFKIWREGLRICMNSIDPGLWPIVIGEKFYPIASPAIEVSPETVRSLLRVNLHREPSAAEIQDWNNRHVAEENEKRVWFLQKHATALQLIHATIDPAIRNYIHGLENAHMAYDRLSHAFGSAVHQIINSRWAEWVGCKYRPNEDALEFLGRWRTALTKLNQCIKSGPVNPSHCVAQFLKAIQSNPGTKGFVNTFRPADDEDSLLDDLFYEFMLTEYFRKKPRSANPSIVCLGVRSGTRSERGSSSGSGQNKGERGSKRKFRV